MSSDHHIPRIANSAGAAMKGAAGFIALLVILFSAGCGGGSTGTTNNSNNKGPVAASVSRTIAAGTAPNSVAVDSGTNKIYVADFGASAFSASHLCSPTGGDVTVIDGTTNLPATITDGMGFQSVNPFAVAVDPANHTVYVNVRVNSSGFGRGCYYQNEYLTVVSGDTFTLSGVYSPLFGSINTNPLPLSVDVNPLSNEIYWLGLIVGRSGAIAVIDGKTNAVTAKVPVGGQLIAVAVNSAANKVYVLAQNGSGSNVTVVDGVTNSASILADLSTTVANAIAVNPKSNTIYVTSAQSNNLTVIDGATGSITATIAAGSSPEAVAVDPQTNFIYVANAGNSQSGDPGDITVIDGTTHETTTLLDPNAKNPSAVAVNPITNKIYVANSGSNNVTLIDGAHN